jgi:hypothetical protein
MVGASEGFHGEHNAFAIKSDFSGAMSSSSLITTQTYHVFPNPFQHETIFSFNGKPGKRKIELYNATGRMVYSTITEANVQTIFKDDIGTGIFIYKIRDMNTQQEFTGKLESQ